MKKQSLFSLFGLLLLANCTNDTLPKPQGYLRLEYPIAKYESFEGACPFTFGKNIYTQIRFKKECDFNIEYPDMKATIFMSYKQINNDLEIGRASCRERV